MWSSTLSIKPQGGLLVVWPFDRSRGVNSRLCVSPARREKVIGSSRAANGASAVVRHDARLSLCIIERLEGTGAEQATPCCSLGPARLCNRRYLEEKVLARGCIRGGRGNLPLCVCCSTFVT